MALQTYINKIIPFAEMFGTKAVFSMKFIRVSFRIRTTMALGTCAAYHIELTT